MYVCVPVLSFPILVRFPGVSHAGRSRLTLVTFKHIIAWILQRGSKHHMRHLTADFVDLINQLFFTYYLYFIPSSDGVLISFSSENEYNVTTNITWNLCSNALDYGPNSCDVLTPRTGNHFFPANLYQLTYNWQFSLHVNTHMWSPVFLFFTDLELSVYSHQFPSMFAHF